MDNTLLGAVDTIVIDTDSYKSSHFLQYPVGTTNMFDYFESRGGSYSHTLFYGLQMLIKKYLTTPITKEMVDEARDFITAHGEPFPYEGWMHIVNDLDGKLPIRIRAVPEGTLVPVSNALYTVEATDPQVYWVVSWLETMLVRLWYPCTVATRSYFIKKMIMESLMRTADDPDNEINFKLHDFGARGSTSRESAEIGGSAHLVNFMGSDTLIGIWGAYKYYNEPMAAFSIPACYDSDTEILTTTGWKYFNNLDKDDVVAQYNENQTIDFCNPEKIIVSSFNGKMINFTSNSNTAGVDLLVTPNHRMIRESVKTGEIEVQTANKAIFSNRNKWLQGGKHFLRGSKLSPLEKLNIAFQADGSYPSRKDAYKANQIRFSKLKKERKITRLTNILEDIPSVEYSISNVRNNDINSGKSFWVNGLVKPLSKTFSWINLSSRSLEWCQDFIEELSYWDSTRKGQNIIYSSIEEYNADMVQAVAILAGYRASIKTVLDSRIDHQRKILYQVNICKTKNFRLGTFINKKELDYEGKIYCVTVPSGMVVVRRNGFVSISGNSEHSTITSWGRENEAEAYRNMLKQFAHPGALVAIVSDSYDLYNAITNIWGEELRQEVIDSGATIIIRPDSGNPPEVVLKSLQLLEEKFGSTINRKGYRVINNVRVIQGDGINEDSIREILNVVMDAGFSTSNINFGMGGGLLQQLDRDTAKFAFKCSEVTVNGEHRDVYKDPATDSGKRSKPGRLDLVRTGAVGFDTIRIPSNNESVEDSALVTVYENGELLVEDTFAEIRKRAKEQVLSFKEWIGTEEEQAAKFNALQEEGRV